MDTICRLCITKTPALTSVFTFKNDRLIADMIALICPVKIDPTDSYPKSVCRVCLRIVTEAYELREKSLQSEVKFKTGKIQVPKTLEHPKTISSSSTRKSIESPKLPEISSIKVEKDPFNTAIEFVDESCTNFDDEFESNESGNEYDDDDDFQEIIPVEPNIRKKSKYEKVTIGEVTRVKCRHCNKIFSNTQNVKRHMMSEHENKKECSTSCNLCGAFISHKTNLNRHIKMHHPESVTVKNEHLEDVIKNSSDLTKKVFSTPKKQKYMEYITITSLENDNCFKYQCLICVKETGKSKMWSQSISNGGTSNIRRHLSTSHPEDFQRLEASINGIGLFTMVDDVQEKALDMLDL